MGFRDRPKTLVEAIRDEDEYFMVARLDRYVGGI